ncbi:MAG: oligosaccharide flippase family protein [Oscillospiraceae bacterium]|nr:oligosaccharide flippase family protein [Oscillospiraceae bacterium]
MKVNQVKFGSLVSYVQIAAGIVIGLAYTPAMIRLLGQSEYGLYNTASSIISMLSILSLGFNSGYIRFFSKYKRENDTEKIHSLNGMYLIIFTLIGTVALICGLILSSHLDIVFDQGLTEGEYQLAYKLMVLLTVNLSISFPMSVFSNIISANEKFILLKLLGLIKTVLSPLVTLPLLLMGFRSVAMVVVTMTITLLVDMVYVYYVVAVLGNKFCFRNFESRIFKELFVYTSFIAINMIVDQVNWNVDKLLLARYRGTISVAVYSVGYTLFSYYMMFSTAVSGVFTPRVHRIVCSASDEKKMSGELTALFVKVGRVQFLILGLIASGLVFYGHAFITNIWAGKDYSESYYVMILLVLSSFVPLIQNLGIEIQRSQNLHKFRSIVYSIMAGVNLVLSIFLCRRYGAVGSAIGTAVSLTLCNGVIMNIYYARKCNIGIGLFWINILGMLKGLPFPIVAGLLLRTVWSDYTLAAWLFKILIYSLVYCLSMWCFAMNQQEKDLFLKPLLRVVRRSGKARND